MYLCIDSLQPVQYCTQYTPVFHKPLKTAMAYVCKSTLCVCVWGGGGGGCGGGGGGGGCVGVGGGGVGEGGGVRCEHACG